MPVFYAIIPAAGRSQRMGRPKLLLPWGGKTIVEHVLAAWRASRVDHAVMVVHPEDEHLAQLGRQCGCIVVRPDDPPAEMKVSVRIALAHVKREFCPVESDAWLLAPADMPTLSSAVIDMLIGAYRAALGAGGATEPTIWASTIWAPAAGGRRGHPVLFPWSLATEVERLGDAEGINALVARHPMRTIDAGAAAIFDDLDTPEDYERLRPREER